MKSLSLQNRNKSAIRGAQLVPNGHRNIYNLSVKFSSKSNKNVIPKDKQGPHKPFDKTMNYNVCTHRK